MIVNVINITLEVSAMVGKKEQGKRDQRCRKDRLGFFLKSDSQGRTH